MPADDYKQITVYVTEEEKRQIERAAAAADLSVSRFLARRGLSEDAIKIAGAREEEAEELRELRKQISGIGRNINQIARHMNRTGKVDPSAARAAVEAAEQASDRILDEIAAIYQD
jgi:hypothetical protein